VADLTSVVQVVQELARKVPHDTLHVVLVSAQSEAVTFHEWTGEESCQRTLDRLEGSRKLFPWLKDTAEVARLFDEICDGAAESVAAEAKAWETSQVNPTIGWEIGRREK